MGFNNGILYTGDKVGPSIYSCAHENFITVVDYEDILLLKESTNR